MKKPNVIRNRLMSDEDINSLKALIKKYQGKSRNFISKRLAENLKWYQPNGRLKDRACRDILNILEQKNLIDLSCLKEKRKKSVKINIYNAVRPSSQIRIDASPMVGLLKNFKPFEIKIVSRTSLEPTWNYLMKAYHYLGYKVLVGACLKYLIFSGERVVGATGWSSPVWKLEARDKAIGWSVQQKDKWLHRLANNTRFLILPWIQIKNLASHLLSININALRSDWYQTYGYRLWLLETFIDPDRFTGSSYKAANWINVGQTKGYQKRGNSFEFHNKKKEVYLYPICKDFRKKIGCESSNLPSLNHKYFFSQKQTHKLGDKRMMLQHANWDPQVLPPLDLTEKNIDAITDEFKEFHTLFKDAFKRVEQIELSQCYIQGLMSPIKRKSMEPIALDLLNTHRVRSLQHFISGGIWDTEKLAQLHKEETSKIVADPLGVLMVDSSEFPKQGKDSVGVVRQYCGRLGKIENCQSGVFIGYSSPKGYTLLDRRLFIPELWFTDDYEARWEKCKIPKDIEFTTKPQLAVKMVKEIQESNLFPAKWITCDTIFSNSPDFINNLPEDLYYLAEIPSNTHVWEKWPQVHVPLYTGKGRHPTKPVLKDGEINSKPVKDIVSSASIEWKPEVLAEGAKGPIMGEIARIRVIHSKNNLPEKECWLFLRKNTDTDEIKYFFSDAPIETEMEEMLRVCMLRWPIEQCFKEGKSEVGMGDYEHRSWEAWHRHMTFVFIAQLFLLKIRHKLKKKPLH